MLVAERDGVRLYEGDALDNYEHWPVPAVIVSDGPYGLGLFPGEPSDPRELASWYEPHARAWADGATMASTLFFWNTEIGWARSHPALEAAGWSYVGSNTWDKTLAFLAGNVNTGALHRYPPVTEVCAQYVLGPPTGLPGGTVQGWLRAEWARTGLPLREANAACGVTEAASRKWLTDDQWYWPPPAMFERLAAYANAHGSTAGAPYFDLGVFGRHTATEGHPQGVAQSAGERWARLRPRFACPFGVTNVWSTPAVRGPERLRAADGSSVHPNQKPLSLMERLVAAASAPGEMVWEPFAGTGTTLVAAWRLGRHARGSEIDGAWARCAARRILDEPAPLFAAASPAPEHEPLGLFGQCEVA